MYPLPATACPLPGTPNKLHLEADSQALAEWLSDSEIPELQYFETKTQEDAQIITDNGFSLVKKKSSFYGKGIEVSSAKPPSGSPTITVAIRAKKPLRGSVTEVSEFIDKLLAPEGVKWGSPGEKNTAIQQALINAGYDTIIITSPKFTPIIVDPRAYRIVVPPSGKLVSKLPTPISPQVIVPPLAPTLAPVPTPTLAGGIKPLPGALKVGDTVVTPKGVGKVTGFSGKAWVSVEGISPKWHAVKTLEFPQLPLIEPSLAPAQALVSAIKPALPKPVPPPLGFVGPPLKEKPGSPPITTQTAPEYVSAKKLEIGQKVVAPTGPATVVAKKGDAWVKLDGVSPAWQQTKTLKVAIAPVAPPAVPAYVPISPKKLVVGHEVLAPTGLATVIEKKGDAWVKLEGVSPAWQQTKTLQVKATSSAAAPAVAQVSVAPTWAAPTPAYVPTVKSPVPKVSPTVNPSPQAPAPVPAQAQVKPGFVAVELSKVVKGNKLWSAKGAGEVLGIEGQDVLLLLKGNKVEKFHVSELLHKIPKEAVGEVQGKPPAFDEVAPLDRVAWERKWKTFWEDLPKESNDSVRAYTGQAYKQINPELRKTGGRPSNPTLYVNGIDAAMERGKTTQDMVVYRGTRKALIPISSTSVGKVFTDHGYVSTTLDKNSAFVGTKWTIRVPAGTPGVYVDAISKVQGEQEFLLPRGTRLRILYAGVDNHFVNTIVAEVVSTGAEAGTKPLTAK